MGARTERGEKLMAKEKPGMMVYFEVADSIRGIPYEEKGRLFEAMLDYARYGVLPTFDGFPVINALWCMVRSGLDADDKRYRKTAHDRLIKGWTNAFKNFYAPQNGIDPDDKAALQKYLAEREREEYNNGNPQISADNNSKPQISNITSNASTTSNASITSNGSPNVSINPNRGIMPKEQKVTGCAGNGTQASKTEETKTQEMKFEDMRQEKLSLLDGYK